MQTPSAASRPARTVLLIVRVAAAIALFAVGIWLIYLFLHTSFVRAQFR